MTAMIYILLLVVATLGKEGESWPEFYQNSDNHLRYTSSQLPEEQQRYVRQDPQQFLDGSTLAKLFQGNFNFYENLNQGKTHAPSYEITPRNNRMLDSEGLYGDYRKTHSVNLVGPGHLETVESEHYHHKVPAFDVSDIEHEHHSEDSHAEVHYHQHKHIHKHEHKQEHAHMHKNQHQHKHSHHQHHKHDHHSEHKHGHDHKHDHHQSHKHDHHHGHKHEHQQKHKHDHHHGHKHQHKVHSHHGHNHGHKYEHGYHKF